MSTFNPEISPSEQLMELREQNVAIRNLCRYQRKQLAEQFAHLQAIRRGIRYVEESLEKSRRERCDWLLVLELHGR